MIQKSGFRVFSVGFGIALSGRRVELFPASPRRQIAETLPCVWHSPAPIALFGREMPRRQYKNLPVTTMTQPCPANSCHNPPDAFLFLRLELLMLGDRIPTREALQK